jgi:UDP-glucose 4-epimerase
MTVLVVGGAGYIGSHMVAALLEAKEEVLILDNLSSGHREAVLGGTLIEGDCGDETLLDDIFTRYKIDTVMHFAASIAVGESVVKPYDYYHNNVTKPLILLKSIRDHKIPHFIFSSTAAVFGAVEGMNPIPVNAPKNPENPYGRSKWMTEQILADFSAAYGISYVVLRYFNAAGADPKGRLGENHDPETHLIPLIVKAALQKKSIAIFGEDYPTPDGTCIRDYIHVTDLCQAHLLAITYLRKGQKSRAFNLGNGQGFSVKEVIEAAEKIYGGDIQVRREARRAGDSAFLVADATEAKAILGWTPAYPEIEIILKHAFNWEKTKITHN